MPIAHPFTRVARAAEKHLVAVEPRFATLVKQHGRCTLLPETDLFRSIVRAVVAQLISTAAARTITGRLEALVKGRITPATLAKLNDEELRGVGLSRSKLKTIRGLIELFQSTRGLTAKLLAADDDDFRAKLLPLHGIGPWTIDMLLMFSLGRPDVWPVGDLGLRSAVKEMFGMPALPAATELHLLAEPWRPYRTIATWYLWRTRG